MIVGPVRSEVLVRRCSCEFIACVCNLRARHAETCEFRKSATCAVGIECKHGLEVCILCDLCTCGAGVTSEDFTPRPGHAVEGSPSA